ncbi:protein tonB [Lysobacteraceae bacterium NML91-0213]|nr:protein tonB [Xanthomonadaceae bacterium NML91-0213]
MIRTLVAALLAASLLALPTSALSQTARQARQEVEASMVVTGIVDIDPQGEVTAHVVDQPEKLPDYVVELVDRAVPAFRFEPLLADGSPASGQAKMSLRLVATQAGDGSMNVAIRSAHFGETYSETDATSVRSKHLRPPQYPSSVLMAGGTGTVYLVVKVGRDGRVEDVAAEQVNLTVVGTARAMESVREALTRASISGARRWNFIPPSEGPQAERDHWVVRVPVKFHIDGRREAGYGEWASYHPGPRTRPDWAAPTPASFSPDLLLANSLTPETSRFRLLTPLDG